MKVYLTLLSNRSYLEGVLVLNNSLKRTGAKYPLYCMLSLDVDTDVCEVLNKSGIECIRLQKKVLEGEVSSNTKQLGWDYSNWNYTFDKIMMWSLSQFEKVVFLDSDMLVVKNIDHLFECPSFTASLAGVMYPGNKGISILNSGLIVFVPNPSIVKEMLSIAQIMIPQMQRENKPLGDQDIINAFFPDWYNHKELILDDGYNLYAHYLQYYCRYERYAVDASAKNKIYVIHFVGKEKPWMINSPLRFLKMCCRMFPNIYYIVACWKYLRMLSSIQK